MGFLESLLVSLLGMAVVFVVLVILMTCIDVTSKVIGGKKKVSDAGPVVPVSVPAAVTTAEPAAGKVYADGSAGEVKIFDVPDRTAAMIMAIVADRLDIPVNQLRFKSIKEVTAK